MTGDRALRMIDLGEVSYLETQSVYHAVATCMDEATPDTIILCRPNSPYLCLGYHQSSLQVLDPVAVSANSLPVMRRRLGGGLTYLDNQQQFYQCIFHRSRSPAMPARVYASRLKPPIDTLRRLGLPAQLRYTNEIEVSGRRIAGIGGGIISQASVVVGNILNDFDYETMASVLNSPCAEFRDLALWAMRQRITTLGLERRSSAWLELPDMLLDAFRSGFNATAFRGELSDNERVEAIRQAEIMTAKSYLEQRENLSQSDAMPILQLKISGSTMTRLVAIRTGSSLEYSVLSLRDGIVEKVAAIQEMPEVLSDESQPSSIAIHDSDEIAIGRRLTSD
ncbi:MAG: hypothetical protein OXI60_01435 [Acidiferrobacterales bacterium]|nr:hypothetical protein [Acidiferrobacterales bacterium]